MFYNKKETKYYIYFVNSNQVIGFNSFEELLLYVINRGSKYDYHNKIYNSFINNINMNLNDIFCMSYWNGERYIREYKLREYLIYDETYRIIDLRNFENLIFSEEYYSYLNKKYANFTYSRYIYRYKKRKKRYKAYYRSTVSIINEKRVYLSSTKEEKKYFRVKRIIQFSEKDYGYQHHKNLEHSWKRQTKCRKQWAKHIK